MNATALKLSMTFAEVYGPGRIYAPRAHEDACEWISRDPMLLDSITGNQIGVMGAMPLVCSEGFNSPAGLELISEAGFEPASTRFHFRAGGSVDAVKKAARETAAKAVLQHMYPDGVLDPATVWIEPRLLRDLNNKAKLAELVPVEHVPPRRVVQRAAFFNGKPPVLPVVLKAVTEQSNGGGAAVMICRSQADLAAAMKTFAPCEEIVVESMLDIQRNPCLHFAVTPGGRVRYLGFADQDISDAGKYRGNWIELDDALPSEVVNIAQEVVRQGAARGYRGIAGVDMVETGDGRIYVLDLNFRVNGSTVAAMLVSGLLEDRGPQVMHLRNFKGAGNASETVSAARSALHHGHLLPLSLYDPTLAGYANQPPILRALVLGADKETTLAIESDLAAAGLV